MPTQHKTMREQFIEVLKKEGYWPDELVCIWRKDHSASRYELIELASVVRPAPQNFLHVGTWKLVAYGQEVAVDKLDYCFTDGCWRRTPLELVPAENRIPAAW